MSLQSSAVTVPATDTDLACLRVARVPEVWPPTAGGQAGCEGPVAAGRAAPPSAAPSGAGPSGAGPSAPSPWPRQFALLLAETLAGARPPRQVLPWMSERGRRQLHRLLPLLRDEHRPRVLRVLTTTPSAGVVEMTVIVLIGTRARALAVRLERSAGAGRRAVPGSPASQWLCTDIEAG
jgi:Family of unknown function (DUF6459)